MKIVKSDPVFSRDIDRVLDSAGFSEREKIMSMIEAFPDNVFIAYSLGSPVGIVCSEAYYERSRAEICIFVVPKHRCKGIGSKLFVQISEHAKSLGVKNLMFSIDKESVYSGFIIKLGFVKKYSSCHMVFSGDTPHNAESFEKYDDSMFLEFVEAEAKAFLSVRLRTGTEPPMIQPTGNVRSFLSNAADSYFVLRDDKGHIIAGAGSYNGVISDVFVEENCRGKGIGRKIVERCIASSRMKGFKNIYLTVVEDNYPAVRLYTSMGFVTERVDDYYTKTI